MSVCRRILYYNIFSLIFFSSSSRFATSFISFTQIERIAIYALYEHSMLVSSMLQLLCTNGNKIHKEIVYLLSIFISFKQFPVFRVRTNKIYTQTYCMCVCVSLRFLFAFIKYHTFLKANTRQNVNWEKKIESSTSNNRTKKH